MHDYGLIDVELHENVMNWDGKLHDSGSVSLEDKSAGNSITGDYFCVMIYEP